MFHEVALGRVCAGGVGGFGAGGCGGCAIGCGSGRGGGREEGGFETRLEGYAVAEDGEVGGCGRGAVGGWAVVGHCVYSALELWGRERAQI